MEAVTRSLKTGFSFGLTSGVITTLGVIVGLASGTGSKAAVVGAILTIAVADAFSDALGIHIAEESDSHRSETSIWVATGATFLTKILFAGLFVLPFLWLDLRAAVITSIVWSAAVLGVYSYTLGKARSVNPWKVIVEHWLVAAVVVLITNYLGYRISSLFGS